LFGAMNARLVRSKVLLVTLEMPVIGYGSLGMG
jgi:hypothetical protein